MSGTEAGHLSLEQLRKYVRNELEPYERERVDQELLLCEGCLWQFMSVMEEARQEEGPVVADAMLPDMEKLEQRIIAELTYSADDTAMPGRGHSEPFGALYNSDSIDADGNASIVEPHKLSSGAQRQEANRRQRGSWLRHPAAQYTIAASITLLLLASGALTGLSEKLQQLDEDNVKPPYVAEEQRQGAVTWSEKMISRTGSWLDGIQASRFNSERNE